MLASFRFPGLYCPGLIEASRESARASSLSLSFRGSIAPASLKPGPGRQGLQDQDAFPGLYCPGLIEARCPP